MQLPPVILRNMLENPGWYTAYTLISRRYPRAVWKRLLNFQQVDARPDRDGYRFPPRCWDKRPRQLTITMQNVNVAEEMPTASSWRRTCIPQTLDVVRTDAETFGTT